MNTTDRIHHTLKPGDRVAYYTSRAVSAGHNSVRHVQVRRTGIVKGWRGGKVIVLHKAGYTEDVLEGDLYCIE
jgi:hypothetical protein